MGKSELLKPEILASLGDESGTENSLFACSFSAEF